MTMTIGGTRVVKGQIKRREEAREIYEAAKSQGKAAALLDQERPQHLHAGRRQHHARRKRRHHDQLRPSAQVRGRALRVGVPHGRRPALRSRGGYTVPGKRARPARRRSFPTIRAQGVVTDPTRSRRRSPRPAPRRPRHLRDGQPGAACRLATNSRAPAVDVAARRTARHDPPARPADPQQGLHPALHTANRLQSALLTTRRRRRVAHRRPARGAYFTLILQPPAAPRRTEVTPKEMVFVIDQTGRQAGWPIEKPRRRCATASRT
jgi:Ca-activated chloride channel family protein